ncbi:50S ribosomal protein L11 methyltransferase [Microbaculum sp. FT89]|uniref:50S ribosomal protein L11 methyltransferase n=1 Tax=Microbaculum sp. FT89 TaxID=3447298 RepID=UPI003F5371AB
MPVRNEAEAAVLTDALSYALEPETNAVSMMEAEKGWLGEAYYTDTPDEATLRTVMVNALGKGAAKYKITIEALADRNWVKESLEALPPIRAGRFAVFGNHDRHRIPANAIPIEIEAGQAFGTGHHGTTLGCLMALDRLLKRRRFFRPLDIGTGTGILAIAHAKAARIAVMATDIDPLAVTVTKENAVKNGVGGLIKAFTANGVDTAAVRQGAPYDLVFANILAKPLVKLAPQVRPLVAPGGIVILSGLLVGQRREVEAAWRAQGCVPLFRIARDGWATLALEAR